MTTSTDIRTGYIVGDLYTFTDDDPRFRTLTVALAYAIQASEADPTCAFGVWTADGEDCLFIAYGGECYRKDVPDDR